MLSAGLFRRLPQGLARRWPSVLESFVKIQKEDGADNIFFEHCLAACVNSQGDHLLKRSKGHGRGGDEDVQLEDSDTSLWHIQTARMIMQLKRQLIKELSEDKLLNYMIEWCDLPQTKAAGCCYDDCCIIYSGSGSGCAAQAWQIM